MKTFISNIIILLLTLFVAMALTMLLDLNFIKAFAVRQFLVYLLITVFIILGFRILYLKNY